MTHTDDRSSWTELDDSIADIIVGYTESMNDDEGKSHIDRIIAAVHASIAARALSDEVVEAYIDHLGWLGDESDVNACRRDIAALLLALGITESEAE